MSCCCCCLRVHDEPASGFDRYHDCQRKNLHEHVHYFLLVLASDYNLNIPCYLCVKIDDQKDKNKLCNQRLDGRQARDETKPSRNLFARVGGPFKWTKIGTKHKAGKIYKKFLKVKTRFFGVRFRDLGIGDSCWMVSCGMMPTWDTLLSLMWKRWPCWA